MRHARLTTLRACAAAPLPPLPPAARYLSPTCKAQVKAFFGTIINRRNTLTGRLYRDDPTIFS